GLYDAAVLAGAGLKRLGRESEIVSLFDVDQMTPAAGQGIVGLETMKTNGAAIEAINAINHPPTARAAVIERGVLQKFGDLLDCYSAVAVHATVGATTTIRAFFGELEGPRAVRVVKSGTADDDVVDAVYEELVEQGAEELVKATA